MDRMNPAETAKRKLPVERKRRMSSTAFCVGLVLASVLGWVANDLLAPQEANAVSRRLPEVRDPQDDQIQQLQHQVNELHSRINQTQDAALVERDRIDSTLRIHRQVIEGLHPRSFMTIEATVVQPKVMQSPRNTDRIKNMLQVSPKSPRPKPAPTPQRRPVPSNRYQRR